MAKIPYLEMLFKGPDGEWTESIFSFAGDIPTLATLLGWTFKATGSGGLAGFNNIIYARAGMLAKNCELVQAKIKDDSGSGACLTRSIRTGGDPTIQGLGTDGTYAGLLINYRSPNDDRYQCSRLIKGVPDGVIGGDKGKDNNALFGKLMQIYHAHLLIDSVDGKFAGNSPLWGFKVLNRVDGPRAAITSIDQSAAVVKIETPGKNWNVGDKVRVSRVIVGNGPPINGEYTVVNQPGAIIGAPNGFAYISRASTPVQTIESLIRTRPPSALSPIIGWAYPMAPTLTPFGSPVTIAESSRRCSSDIITRRRVRKRAKAK